MHTIPTISKALLKVTVAAMVAVGIISKSVPYEAEASDDCL